MTGNSEEDAMSIRKFSTRMESGGQKPLAGNAHIAAVDKARRTRATGRSTNAGLATVGELDAATANVVKAFERLQLLSDQAKSDLAATEDHRAAANADYQRAMKLFNDKAISRQEFDELKSRFQDADRRWKDMQGANPASPRGSPLTASDIGLSDVKTRPTAGVRDPLDLAERYLKASPTSRTRAASPEWTKNPEAQPVRP